MSCGSEQKLKSEPTTGDKEEASYWRGDMLKRFCMMNNWAKNLRQYVAQVVWSFRSRGKA